MVVLKYLSFPSIIFLLSVIAEKLVCARFLIRLKGISSTLKVLVDYSARFIGIEFCLWALTIDAAILVKYEDAIEFSAVLTKDNFGWYLGSMFFWHFFFFLITVFLSQGAFIYENQDRERLLSEKEISVEQIRAVKRKGRRIVISAFGMTPIVSCLVILFEKVGG